MADSEPATSTPTPSWMDPSPTDFNDTQNESTPEKQKQSRRTGNLKDSWTAGRAKRGTLGSFAGRRPPKSPTKLAAFEKAKAKHYEQQAARRLQAQSGGSERRQRRKEPMRVASMQPKENQWQQFVAKEFPLMQGDFTTKMVELSKKWKNMKDNNRAGQKPSS